MKHNSDGLSGLASTAATAATTPRDARALQKQLAGAVKPAPQMPPEPGPPADRPEVGPPVDRRKSSGGAVWVGRLFKSLLALAILAAVVWAPVQVLLQASSVEAVVNGRLVVLRAPIEGHVAAKDLPVAGDFVAAGTALLQIGNPRIDHSAVDRIEQQIADLSAERNALIQRLAAARAAAAALTTQLEAFRKARISILDFNGAILDQQIIAGQEQSSLAASEAMRAHNLQASGAVAAANADRAASTATIAAAALAELKLQRQRLGVERQALAKGVFIGDSYNDRPQSAQRRDEVERQITELGANLSAGMARQRDLQTAAAQARIQETILAVAEISVPLKARVWEVLVTSGEQVSRGQDLVRLLSCNTAVVTAAVSESVYNRLYAGMPAQFVPRGASEGFPGTIVNLTGMAGASSNYAIDPSALVKEPYRVTVAVPSLATTDDCAIGRTGRVMFGEAAFQPATTRLLNTLRSYFQ